MYEIVPSLRTYTRISRHNNNNNNEYIDDLMK